MKNILTKLFGKEEPNNKEIMPPSYIPEALYNLGWEINISGSKRVSSEWQRVNEKDINEAKESLKNQVEEMHKILEKAHTQKKEFVNLESNVFRLNDVSSVTSYCYKILVPYLLIFSYMLRLSFKIQNIFSKDIWYDMYTYTKQLSRNKYFESQLVYSDHTIVEFVLDLSWNGRDHAGPNIEASLFGYHLIVGIYDTRHWDYKEAKWETITENN